MKDMSTIPGPGHHDTGHEKEEEDQSINVYVGESDMIGLQGIDSNNIL